MGAGPERPEASSSEASASQESGKASGAQDLRGRASAQLDPGVRSAPEGPRGARAVRHLRPSASFSVSRDTLGLRGGPLATSRTFRARFSRAEWEKPRTARALMGHGASVVRLVPLAFPAPQRLRAPAPPAHCVSTPRTAPPLPHQLLRAPAPAHAPSRPRSSSPSLPTCPIAHPFARGSAHSCESAYLRPC